MDNETDDHSSETIVAVKCSICTMTIDDVKQKFKCRTCEQKASGDSSDEISGASLCEICIQTHTRRKHDVLDYKDMKVVVCEHHLVYCGYFCLDCDRLICNMCAVQTHAMQGHKYVPVSQQANEIKNKIHEVLSDIDEDYKPIVKKLASAEKLADQVGKLRLESDGIKTKIVKILQNTLEELNEEFTAISTSAIAAESNANKFVKEIKKIISTVESKQSKLRDLLSFSDGWLVKEFSSDACDISNDEIFNNLVVSATSESSDVTIDAEENLKESFKIALKNYAEEVRDKFNLMSEEGKDQNLFPLPANCTHFRTYPNQKIVMAASDSHLCIAHFRENSNVISFEFIDRNNKKTMKSVNVDSKFFRLFSCYGGVIFQTGEKYYQAFKFKDTRCELLDRWRIEEPNVQGFFYHEGGFYHHYYTISLTSQWNWLFANNLYDSMTWSPVSFISPASYLDSNNIFVTYYKNSESGSSTIYRKKKARYVDIGSINFLSIGSVTNFAFEFHENQPVVIAYSISEIAVRFAYKQSINDTFDKNGRFFSKLFDLKSVKEVQFFNSDCYFVTEEGNLIRHINFFSEL